MPDSPEMNVDGTLFRFPPSWTVSVFDQWPQYKKVSGTIGTQGCDVVAVDGDVLWLIEMKDYTYEGSDAPESLDTTLGRKAMGTMFLLYALERAVPDSAAKEFARAARDSLWIHLALHVEVKDAGRKEKQLKPLLAALKTKIRPVGRTVGAHKVFVTSTLVPDAGTPWQARRDPATRSGHQDR